MRTQQRKGVGFGMTSGVITTLGLIFGLYSSTESRLAILGGVLVIAFADSMSDAFGIHISEESEFKHSKKEIWQATISTFFSKFIVVLTFLIPILAFGLNAAVIICMVWGLFLIVMFSIYISRHQGIKPYSVVGEHLFIAMAVIVISYYVGRLVEILFI